MEVVRYINLKDQPEVLYSDEKVFRRDFTTPSGPLFKPDWSPFLHLAVNYTTHLSVYRRQLVQDVGGFRAGFEGSQDHDLMLRATAAATKPVVHVPFCLYQWRRHEASTAGDLKAKPYAADAGLKAVKEHCAKELRPAEVTVDRGTGHYRVRFELPNPIPKVSVVIPSKNAYPLIKRCLDSLFDKTTYDNFEVVVVDNGSNDPTCQDLYRSYQGKYGPRFSVLPKDIPFNFAALCNAGVERGTGTVVILLNNDTEVIDEGWMRELASLTTLDPVGAVGAKLLYPDGSVQHAGVTLMDRDIAHHSFKFLPGEAATYLNLLQTRHEVSGVTGACLAVTKANYQKVGGLDEIYLPNGFGDVDFCLKLRREGLVNLYTPDATLIHHESQSRGSNIEVFEKHVLIQRWGDRLILDPYRNLNLQPHPNFVDDPAGHYPELSLKEFDSWLASYKWQV